MGPATQYAELPEAFEMHRGGSLPGGRIAFETWGTLNAAADNALLILTGLSPGAHAASSKSDPESGWWEPMLGPGKAIDTDRWYVICVNSLGSCKGSTGPAETNPRTNAPYRLEFPELALEDVARGAACVLDSLGVDQPAALIGPSMGGMSCLAFAALYPQRARKLVLISSAASAAPFAIAIRSLQREVVRADRGWAAGNYGGGADLSTGMRLARKIGMTTYRSPEEWRDRFGRERVPGGPSEAFGAEFQIESYLEAHAQRFITAFDPNCYLYLSRAMDWFDLADHGDGNLQQALNRLQVDTALVMGVGTDFLFPLWQQEELARGLSDAGAEVQWCPLPSPMGHDSFLVDYERFCPPIREYLGSL